MFLSWLSRLELSFWYLAGCLVQCLLLLGFRLRQKDKALLAVPAVFFSAIVLLGGEGQRDLFFRLSLYSLMYGISFTAFFYKRLLPVVSEHILLFYTLIFWYAYLSFRPLEGIVGSLAIGLALIPSLAVLSDWLSPRPHGRFWRYLGYCWFLAVSLALAALQYSQHRAFQDLSRAELFLCGMSFLFLSVVSSLFIAILPLDIGRNKKDRRLGPGRVWERDMRMIDRRTDPRALSFGMGALLIALEGGLFISNARYAYCPPWLMIQFAIVAVPVLMGFAERLAEPGAV